MKIINAKKNMTYVKLNISCRICGSKKIFNFLNLGHTPLADDFLDSKESINSEKKYPLEVGVCEECNLVMLMHSVNNEKLFGENYAFFTSCSPQAVLHFRDCARKIESRYKNFKDNLIVEIASNDGVLLRPLIELGFNNVLGIEPASSVASMARSSGINTINKFFNKSTAQNILADYGDASIIIANNVVAHVDNLNDFISGIELLLSDDGVFIFEIQYFPNILYKNQFDNIYHEHHSFFSIKPIELLLKNNNLKIIDIEEIKTQGGSLRIHATKNKNCKYKTSLSVDELRKKEISFNLDDMDIYKNYNLKIEKLKENLLKILTDIKASGKKIVGYGAPAKGNTLLNYCQIDTKYLDYIIDKTYFKHGKFSPGMHIPVYPVEKILEDGPPDYYLLLVWNYADGILASEENFRRNGGKFIIPIPEPVVV